MSGIRASQVLFFLMQAVKEVKERGYTIGSLDVTVVAQRPKLSLYKASIRKNLAQLMNVGEYRINVKAKTKEGLDAVGRGEAIEAYAVVMLE